MYAEYAGRRAMLRTSINGMLANQNIAVIATAPAITYHHAPGAAARPNNISPHQNESSPK